MMMMMMINPKTKMIKGIVCPLGKYAYLLSCRDMDEKINTLFSV